MNCSRCGAELPSKPSKEWIFKKGYYKVKSYSCPNCKKNTLAYYHEGKLGFTIPKVARKK